MGGGGGGGVVDPLVLSYGDIALRQSDVDLLAVDSREWLNDAVISFAFEYLNNQHPSVECLHVSCTNMLAMIPRSSTEMQEGLSVAIRDVLTVGRSEKDQKQKLELVVAAVNNSMEPMLAESGSHWSLLVYEASSQTFFSLRLFAWLERETRQRSCETAGRRCPGAEEELEISGSQDTDAEKWSCLWIIRDIHCEALM